MSEKCGRMQNIKGVIHKCGKTKGHYDNQSLHGCTCGYEWDIRGSYIFSGSPLGEAPPLSQSNFKNPQPKGDGE